MGADEEAVELDRRHFAGEVLDGQAGADPVPGGLAVAEVVVLGRGGHLGGVVADRAGGDFRPAQHWLAPSVSAGVSAGTAGCRCVTEPWCSSSVDIATCTVRDLERQESLEGVAGNAQGAAEDEDGKAFAAGGDSETAAGELVGGASADAEVARCLFDSEQLREIPEARSAPGYSPRPVAVLVEELFLACRDLHAADRDGRHSRRRSRLVSRLGSRVRE